MLACLLIKCWKKNDSLSRLCWLARSPFVLTEHISSKYIYIWRYLCHYSSACHAYVMWEELGHCHFLYVPAVLNVVSTGNGTGTKNVLKRNRALRFEFSIQSSVYGATTVAKVCLFSSWIWCTVSLYSM